MVQISIQDTTRESKVMLLNPFFGLNQSENMQCENILPWFLQTCYGTNNPIWSDAFTFFIQDPRKQDIDIQVSFAVLEFCLPNIRPRCDVFLSSGER